MTREEYIDFANALKNNYTIDFDKLPEFCDMAISALSTDGEYIKKSELLQHVVVEELSDFKDRDVIHAEVIDELTTYSFPNSENKGDLISKEQANAKLKAICERMNFEYNDKYGEGTSGYAFVHAFDDIPSADNKGEWIHVIDSYYEDGTQKESHWECSKCGSGRSGWGEFKFCPDCGADMREPKDIIHKAIDNTTFAEEAYPNIKEELHKAVDMAESEGE